MGIKQTYRYAVLAMLFWGVSYVASKIVLQYYSPVTMVFLRLVISSLVLSFYIFLLRRMQKIRKEHIWLFLLSALFNPFLYFLGESHGIKLVSPTVSAVIIGTIPLFTPVVAYFAVKERLTTLNIFGIMMSFAGLLIMLFDDNYSFRADPMGILYLFGSVASAVIFTVILKKLTVHYTPLCIITYQNIIGVVYFLPLVLFFQLDDLMTVPLNAELVTSLLFLAIFASSIAFIFYTIAVKHLGMSKANVFSNLIPVFAAIASLLIWHEFFDFNKTLGIVVVICGVLLSQTHKIKIYNKTRKKEIKV